MTKYHINPETGRANQCTAHKRPCKFGIPEDNHHATKEDARAAYEKSQESNTFPTISKKPKLEKPKSTGLKINVEKADEGERYVDNEGKTWQVAFNYINYHKERDLAIREVDENGELSGPYSRVSSDGSKNTISPDKLERVEEMHLDVLERNLAKVDAQPRRHGDPYDEQANYELDQKAAGLRKEIAQAKASQKPTGLIPSKVVTPSSPASDELYSSGYPDASKEFQKEYLTQTGKYSEAEVDNAVEHLDQVKQQKRAEIDQRQEGMIERVRANSNGTPQVGGLVLVNEGTRDRPSVRVLKVASYANGKVTGQTIDPHNELDDGVYFDDPVTPWRG